ncbi:MAG TPA: hypothetical protein IAA06_15705 [Candidatus Blautia faecavium]|uniref:Uncharacterized protein n=1 Tax=Candidatus Blautia faecavium TaxID=2838487 RepID=A0A9D2LVR2_9FIRM|nr:hypothetical protein [Candidatus Blautia faecavium]
MNEKRRRIFMTVVGIGLSGISVGMFNFSDFGMDPFQVFAHGIWNLTSIGFGTFYTILSLVLLAAVFIMDKSKIGLGTLINLFLLGYVTEFSSWVMESLFPDPQLWLKTTFLLIGILVLCFGSALYFTADLGVSTYDAIALYLAEHTRFPFQLLRITTDFICVAIGFSFNATVGIGTLITAFFMGPVIAFFRRHVSEPFRYGKTNKPQARPVRSFIVKPQKVHN